MTGIRVVAHVHSDWSYDGSWELAAIARAFARRGYDAVLMAEHDRGFDDDRWRDYLAACARASADGALLVPGIEYSDHRNLVHVTVWGDLPFLGEGKLSMDLLRKVRQRGGTAMLAHPDRRDAWSTIEPDWWDLLDAVEVWNRKYDGWAPGVNGRGLIAREGRPPMPFVGLDFHTRRQFCPLALRIETAEEKSVDEIYAALRAGRVQPRAVGLSVQRLSSPPWRWVLSGAEHLRRGASRVRRRFRSAARSSGGPRNSPRRPLHARARDRR